MKWMALVIFVLVSSTLANSQVGNVGINTTAPAAMLHVKDSSVVFTGIYTLPLSPGLPPISGIGTRMMWYPDKSAFRVGVVSGNRWDRDQTGIYSIAMGMDPKASEIMTTAIGNFSTASAPFSVAIGAHTQASGNYSLAMGQYAHASGLNATAIGDHPTASGYYSTALGNYTKASAYYSTAIGFYTTASGFYSTAMGAVTTASGERAFSIGYLSHASGKGAIAAGLGLKSKAHVGAAFGSYNDSTNVVDPINFHPDNRIFQIGNGTADNLRSNAMTVLQNGNIGIGTTSPGFLLNFPSGLGDKISLWGSSGNHYGFGIQNNLLQIHTDGSGGDVAFGYGSSDSFNETMRIKGNGNVGIGITSPDNLLDVGGRIRVRYGEGNTAGIYFNKNDNSSEAGFVGTFSDDNYIGMFGSNGAGWGVLMNTTSGNVGIGTSNNALSKLHVQNGAVLFQGSTGSTPISGSGARMMWIPNKKALRAGDVYQDTWDNANIGLWSVAFGFDCLAYGDYSFSHGLGSESTGEGSFSHGDFAKATGHHSIAIGELPIASGENSISLGDQNTASETHAIAIGSDSKASGWYSTAIGHYAEAKGDYSVTIGYQLKSKAHLGIVIGNYNDSTNASNGGFIDPNNRLFQIGNGTADDARSNALTVLQNGNIGIGTNTPLSIIDIAGRMRLRNGTGGTAGFYINNNNNSAELGFIGSYGNDNLIGMYGYGGADWGFVMNTQNGNIGIGTTAPSARLNVVGNGLFTGSVTASCGVLVCSDIRYKKNILPVTNALNSLQSIHGIYYNWDNQKFADKNFGDERQIGFSAQELEKVYPEMVKTDANGFKTVDYSRLTPVLVEAVKEQQLHIEEQDRKIEMLIREVEAIKSKIGEK